MSSTLHKLQYLRKKKGMSQDQMAQKLGMTVHGYRKIEQGSRRMTLELAIKIKGIVDVAHIEDILDAG
ncbi:helix-turn-helix transcriptional regulator [Paenibacillus sp. FSL L8-0499]|uniref:helix-turn-helix transcriptional regulator n=1 Tax=Paenibacillus sp. FSL L8-0499 TaxID=2975334 RepID=UPI0030FB3894